MGYCYSARGETTDVYESTPHSGGYYHVPMTYWANGLVNTFGPFLTQDQQIYTPDGEGRAVSAGGFTPTITYNAASQPTQLMTSCNAGTCYPITYTYDPNTLRMTQYSAALSGGTISGTMQWNQNGSLNNLVIADPFNSADAQTCTYGADDLSRLASVNCVSPNGPTTWAQTFSYDPFGNLTKSGSITWQPGYNASTNQYALAGTSYDADGNLLNDTFNTYTWDADGKNLSTAYQGGETASIINDVFGHPVEVSNDNGVSGTSYLRLGKFKLSAVGQTPLHSEYPLPGGSVLGQGGGGHLVYMADWLGTIRASWLYTGGGYSGSPAHAPFGESYNQTGGYAAGFAGETWGDGDPTNTTYWFPERHLRSSQGRWLTPDPAGIGAAEPSNPQTWNRYAYVRNSPLTIIDPLGDNDCAVIGAGLLNTPSSGTFEHAASQYGAEVAYPYASEGFFQGIGSVLYQSAGLADSSTRILANKINSAARLNDSLTLYLYSASAQAFTTGVANGLIDPAAVQKINQIVYLSPGMGWEDHNTFSIPATLGLSGSAVQYFNGYGFLDGLVSSTAHGGGGSQALPCGHDFGCLFNNPQVPKPKGRCNKLLNGDPFYGLEILLDQIGNLPPASGKPPEILWP